jgi:hypothetical protein
MPYIPPDFAERFQARTKMLRESAGYRTTSDMGRALGIKPDTYSKYELRSLLPHHLIPKFLELTGADYKHLFGPSQPAQREALGNREGDSQQEAARVAKRQA